MEVVKKTENYIIYKKRSGRYGIKNASGKWINGSEKTNILVEEGLIKAAPVKAPEPEAEETATEEVATEESASAEAPAEQ